MLEFQRFRIRIIIHIFVQISLEKDYLNLITEIYCIGKLLK